MRISGQGRLETWKYAKPFVIARGALVGADLLVVELTDGHSIGRGEACPMPYFGETPEGQLQLALDTMAGLESVDDWLAMHDSVPKGAARNAIDCAVWDLRAKQAGRPVTDVMGLAPLRQVTTAYTLGIDDPSAMQEKARWASPRYSLLKIKLGDWAGDLDRIAAIRAVAPGARLIADVNEGWNADQLVAALPALKAARVEMVEQPLRAGEDQALAEIDHIVPIGADESCFVAADLDGVARLYDFINIKLDKSGGLTEAMRLVEGAKARNLGLMIGCMMATSLGIAPGVVVAQHCAFVDLDAPLMLSGDREIALAYADDQLPPPPPELWG